MSGILYIGKKGSDVANMAYAKAAEILAVDTAQISSHPDYLFVGLDDKAKSIGVDKAALIVEKASLKPAVASNTVCVIDGMDKCTVEAQNKLLKTLEESSMIVLGICYEDNLLATVKSRMQICRAKDGTLPNEVSELFSKVEEILDGTDYQELLRVLNLVKEKDTKSFFQTNREYVGELIALIGNKCSSKLNEEITLMLSDHRLRALGSGYSKDDFFLLIATIVSFFMEE